MLQCNYSVLTLLQVLTPLQVGTCNGAVCLQCTYTVANNYTVASTYIVTSTYKWRHLVAKFAANSIQVLPLKSFMNYSR